MAAVDHYLDEWIAGIEDVTADARRSATDPSALPAALAVQIGVDHEPG